MSLRAAHIDYLYKCGITPRLNEILDKLCAENPLPDDPLMYVLQELGCPLIPPEEMNALEHQLDMAVNEVHYLQDILCKLGYEHECNFVFDEVAARRVDCDCHHVGMVDANGMYITHAMMTMVPQPYVIVNHPPPPPPPSHLPLMTTPDEMLEEKPCCSNAILPSGPILMH